MISINYLLFSRPSFLELNSKIIQKISDKNKSKIKINFLATSHSLCQIDEKIMGYIEDIQKSGIQTHFEVVPLQNNYLQKIRIGINDGFDYCLKWDEDIFISHHLWNFLIENIESLLEDSLFVTLPLSTGIPSTDIFIENIFDEDEKQQINSIFKSTPMPSIWGFNYTSLNEHTINSKEWLPDNFYNSLEKLNYHYSGIHPVRLNYKAQKFILDTSIKHSQKIFGSCDFYLTEMVAPYFCNSFFAIKTKDWKQILETPELFVDDFDEVALNRYWKRQGLKGLYINGTGGIHLYYNTINHYGHGFVNECNLVYEKLKENLNEDC